MKGFWHKLHNTLWRTCDNNINYNTMKKMLKDDKSIIVIDVRTRDEYKDKHIYNAINIPLQDISESILNRYINNKSKQIIVYCEYGGRSVKACNKLKKLGYQNVYNLEGGIKKIGGDFY